MSKTTSRVLWIIAGIFLIIAGIGCMRNPGEMIYELPFIFGVAMMFSGIVDIVIYAMGHNYMADSGWFLADGILTVLLSLFVLLIDIDFNAFFELSNSTLYVTPVSSTSSSLLCI